MLGGRNIRNTFLLQGAPVLAARAMATSSQAWAQEGAQGADSSVLEGLVVPARRANESIQRKKHADVIIDRDVADDAGKSPHSSITEVLQRASGVAIARFRALGDPDGSSAEGGGGFE
jgi:outer membrane cobalamin receptor